MAVTQCKTIAVASTILSFGLVLASGCNNGQGSSTSSGPAPGQGTSGPGGPGAPGGPGGMMGRGPGGMRGGPGGMMGRGAPVAANATGEEIYKQKCGCHGPNGKGGRAPVLTGGAGKSEDELAKIIHDGKGRMPSFASQLTDDQIKKVAATVKGFK